MADRVTRKRGRASSPKGSTAFTSLIEDALTHFTDPEWLGANSPLASPYLMGATLRAQPRPETVASRGRALQQLLISAAQAIPTRTDRRFDACALLHAAYFRPKRRQNLDGVATELELPHTTFYRYRQEAVRLLEQSYMRLAHPSVRVEVPRADGLVGRGRELDAIVQSLRASQVVMLSGPAGVGKTTLGARAAREAAGTAAFWFTLRPSFNMDVRSFAFALGLYLQGHGSPMLWLQLTADRGETGPALVAQLARAGLAEVFNKTGALGVVCIDEADLLRASATEEEEIGRLRGLLEALAEAPRAGYGLLVVGQTPMMEAGLHVELSGLSAQDTATLLRSAGLALDAGGEQRLHAATGGNALLLRMAAALSQSGAGADDVLEAVRGGGAYGVLVERVVRRLDAPARGLLSALTVYDGGCPEDAWRESAAALERLIGLGLVRRDGAGGVQVHGVVRELLYRRLSAEDRETYHLVAASVYCERGMYTDAAAQYVAANRPEDAVRVWFANREGEINHGQAGRARAVFWGISREGLSGEGGKKLALIRAQLAGLRGEVEEGLRELEGVKWPAGDAHTPGAMELQGWFNLVIGRRNDALDHYRRGFESAERQLQEKQIDLLERMSGAQVKGWDLEGMGRTAALARYMAEMLQGDIHDSRGEYDAARSCFQRSLLAASELTDDLRLATSHFRLGSLAARVSDAEGAQTHLEAARERYAKAGDIVRAERTRSNLALMHLNVGHYQKAVLEAEAALGFFERSKQPHWVALNAVNAAEAHLCLGELEAAERMAWRALKEEEVSLRSYALYTLAQVARERGQAGEAERYARESVSAAQETQDKWAEAPAWRALGQALRAKGEEGGALEAFDAAIRLYADMRLPHEIQRTLDLRGTLDRPTGWTGPSTP